MHLQGSLFPKKQVRFLDLERLSCLHACSHSLFAASDYLERIGEQLFPKITPANMRSRQGKRRPLFWQQGEKPKVELLSEAGPILFRKGVEGPTLFRGGANGKVVELVERRNNEDVVWRKLGASE